MRHVTQPPNRHVTCQLVWTVSKAIESQSSQREPYIDVEDKKVRHQKVYKVSH
jgi:hypothetical protein